MAGVRQSAGSTGLFRACPVAGERGRARGRSSAAVALARFNEIVGPDPRHAGKPKAAEGVTPTSSRPEVDYRAVKRGDDLAGRFRIEEKLGDGGFAAVYRVFDSFADTRRVLKIIVKDRRSTFQRLKQEYIVLERLEPHPNVVRVVWADKLPNETPYIVFEYVPGTGVDELLSSGSVSLEDVRRLGLGTLPVVPHRPTPTRNQNDTRNSLFGYRLHPTRVPLQTLL